MRSFVFGLAWVPELCYAVVISPVQFIHGTSSVHLQPAFAQDHIQKQISHVAVPKDIRMNLLQKFSPNIYLHPDDQYLPADPALTFEKYYNAATDSMSIPTSELSGMPLSYDETHEVAPRNDLDLDHFRHRQSLSPPRIQSNSPSNTSSDDYNDFRRPGARSGKGRVTAPVTAQARVITKGKQTGKILLQYWYWHFFNGAQGFSVLSDYGTHKDEEGVTRWEWWPLAIHNADWEHTTITLSPVPGSTKTLNDLLTGNIDAEDYELESVYYTVHNEVEDKIVDFPREGTHPVVYSHLNSHACYAIPGDYWNKDPAFDGFVNSVVRFLTFGKIKQIKVVDIGFKPEEAIKWSNYKIYDISDATEGDAPDWALWKGHWGDSVDQTKPTGAPSYVPSRKTLDATLWLLRVFGKLKKFVKLQKKAPRGPFGHWNWLTLDVLADDWVAPLRHPPPLSAIILFVTTVILSIGAFWALLASFFVVLVMMARYGLKKSRPAIKSMTRNVSGYLIPIRYSPVQVAEVAQVASESKVDPGDRRGSAYNDARAGYDDGFDIQEDEDEERGIQARLLRWPRESFETDGGLDSRRRRRFEWVRELYARARKSMK